MMKMMETFRVGHVGTVWRANNSMYVLAFSLYINIMRFNYGVYGKVVQINGNGFIEIKITNNKY